MNESDRNEAENASNTRRMWLRRAIVLLTGLVVTMGLLRWMFSQTSPAARGIVYERLADCPSSPNCVCSCQTSEQHGIAPLAYTTDPQVAMELLKSVLLEMPRTQLIANDPNYLYVTFTTPLMGYVDDVECLLDEASQQIHIRSASRVGHSDLGANRKRVEEIRQRFQQRQSEN